MYNLIGLWNITSCGLLWLVVLAIIVCFPFRRLYCKYWLSGAPPVEVPPSKKDDAGYFHYRLSEKLYKSKDPALSDKKDSTFYHSIYLLLPSYPPSLIRNAVLTHYLHVHSHSKNGETAEHPFHDKYAELGMRWRLRHHGQFYLVLQDPDLKDSKVAYEIVARALGVQLTVYRELVDGRARNIAFDGGIRGGTELKLIVRPRSALRNRREVRYSALVEETSGAQLVSFLEKYKKSNPLEGPEALDLKELAWEWKGAEYLTELTGYNEYIPGAKENDRPRSMDKNCLNSFTVHALAIHDHRQIGPALALLRDAVALSPGQGYSVAYNEKANKKKTMPPYVAVDAEFKTVERNEQLMKFDQAGYASDEYQIVSVLTFAVDRHLVFSFYLLDMLENADPGTVEAISELLKQTVFNPRLLKVWWNYHGDFKVLDHTIAHMFQGTIRRRKVKNTEEQEEYPFLESLRKSQYLQGTQPPALTLSSILTSIRGRSQSFRLGGRREFL